MSHRPRPVLASGALLAVTLLLFAPPSRSAPAPRDSSAADSAASRPHDERLERLGRDGLAGIRVLAAPVMEGRGIGTKGIGLAADWVEKQLRAEGLSPAFGTSYRQRFKIKTGISLAKGNFVEGVADTDWVPLGFSSSGPMNGEIAFLGYGISAPPVGYDELEGVDLHRKVALMLRYEPQEKDAHSPFDGRNPSRWSALRYKTMRARELGAVGVIFVTGPIQDEGKNRLPALANDGPESPAGIPVIQVRTSVAERWLGPLGIDLATFQKAVDRDLTPRDRVSTGVRIRGRIALDATYAETDNLAGVITGAGPLARQVVVVGAHYDHLGYGGRGSMRPNVHAIHPGADDNASGTVSVLLAAHQLLLELAHDTNHRAVVAILFSGEEVGLAGSSWFVHHPPFPMGRVAAMVNLDMVGRLRNDRLTALGSDTAPQWKDEIARAATDAHLEVTSRGDGYGPSDQTAFYGAGVPVLHLFTGAHEQYHTPDDVPSLINSYGMAQVIDFTSDIVGDLARKPERPVYVRATSAPLMEGDSRGYGAWLGTVPDYTAMEATTGGVLLADVRPGGPAERAGLRGKDRIVAMAGTRIENLYDMTYALQDHKPGSTIDVVVIRGGKRLTMRATLGDRATMGAPAARPGPAPAAAGKPAAAPAPGGPPAAAPAAPANPHAGLIGAGEPDTARVTLPLPDRPPGPDFTPRAGKPFGKRFDGERHLADIRQLTFGGENAEPYWSPDGKEIIFQATPPGRSCDQQYIYNLATDDVKMVSSGKGRTTCGYFDYPEMDRIVYASTQAASDSCPPPPDYSKGYVWAIYPSYDIYEANLDGSDARKLVDSPGYDAEATWCHRGGRIIFTSMRDGDLDLYSMDETGGDVRRLTNTVGYDGGAFYSPDCSEIVWRASRPKGAELTEYEELLKQNLIRPHSLELYIAKADGRDARQITSNGAANFCPTFLPDGRRILWSSNVGAPDGREFDLYLMDKNGGPVERVTTAPGFDGFPHMSPDGRWIVWSSNRADPQAHQTNLFLARWVDNPEDR